MAAAPPANASNAELARWSFEMLNTHDVSVLRQFWTDETVERFPDRTRRGPDEMAAYFQEVFDALPDFHMEVIHVTEQDDHVFVQWKLTGTHSGATYQGIEPTGRRIELDGIDHFVIRDGKVASNFVVFDQMQFARQLGLLPPDGSQGDRAFKAAFNLKNKVGELVRQARS
jgi:steroid delta-isomerase-like uncharacterized protein